jgi:Lar family restriction alleviation protein
MTDKLRECPFCGGENVGVFSWNPPFRFTKYSVHCYDCHFGLYEVDNKEDAIKAWNTRKPMDRIVEQLEEEKNHCCVGSYEDYDPYEDGRFETYEEVIALLKGVQNE